MNGILLIDKPEGPTSAEVVRRVARVVRPAKVGHLGTLDPFASGVLPLCVGEGTRIARFLNAADKEYEGVIRLGLATDTGDRTGDVSRTTPVPDLDAAAVDGVAREFAGDYEQTPPMYSAIKRGGVPLYKLARRGIEVDRPSRMVRIDSLDLRVAGAERLEFHVACSKGTYVRVLAEDIGARLGSAAHLETLRRTKFGFFEVAEAIPLDDWSPDQGRALLTVRDALGSLPSLDLTEDQCVAVSRGQTRVLAELPATAGDHAVLIGPGGDPVAVVARQGGRWGFARVLRGAS